MEKGTVGGGRPDGMELGVERIPKYVSRLSTSFMPVYSSSGGMSERWWGVVWEGGARVARVSPFVIS